MASGK
jgi:hypothetical protein